MASANDLYFPENVIQDRNSFGFFDKENVISFYAFAGIFLGVSRNTQQQILFLPSFRVLFYAILRNPRDINEKKHKKPTCVWCGVFINPPATKLWRHVLHTSYFSSIKDKTSTKKWIRRKKMKTKNHFYHNCHSEFCWVGKLLRNLYEFINGGEW